MTKMQVIKLMAANNIKGEVTGAGKNWEVKLPNHTQMKKFCKFVANVGGHNNQCGEWYMKPGATTDMGEYCDRSSRWHY